MADGWDGAGIVKSGLGLSGLYELEPIRLTYLNETLGLDPAAAARNSPALLTPAGAAPLLLAVGGDERAEFLRQQQAMEDAWLGEGVPITSLVLPGHNHYTIVELLGDADGELAAAVRRQMGLG